MAHGLRGWAAMADAAGLLLPCSVVLYAKGFISKMNKNYSSYFFLLIFGRGVHDRRRQP